MSWATVGIAAFGAALICWVWFAVRVARDLLEVVVHYSASDEGLRRYTLFQLVYSLAVASLALCVLGALFYFKESFLTNPWTAAPLAAAVFLLPICSALYRASLSDGEGLPGRLTVQHYISYLWQRRKRKADAERVKPLVPIRYKEPDDIRARVVLPSVHYLLDKYGEPETRALLQELDMPLEYVLWQESVLSNQFAYDLFEAMHRKTGTARSVFEGQSRAATLECMGILFFLIARSLSVRKVYQTIVTLGRYLDSNFRNEILESSPTHIRIRVTPLKADLMEHLHPYGHHSVAGWISSIPNVRGLPHAKVTPVGWNPAAPEEKPPEYLEYDVRWVNSLSEGGALIGEG